MGAYNFTSMMRQERSMKFRNVEVKGMPRLLLFLIFLLLSTTGLFFFIHTINKAVSFPIATIYALISTGVFLLLQSLDINEHIYKIINFILPKKYSLIYYEDEIHLLKEEKEWRKYTYVYKTNTKRRKTTYSDRKRRD